jgi:multicomponent Na+:H+ antiporter subunit F
MTPWLTAAAAMLVRLVPCCIVVLRARIMERLVALQLAQIIVVLAMIMMAVGSGRSVYLDIPLAMSVLSLASGLVYVRFLERWL